MTQHNTTLPPRDLTLFCELITAARRKAGRLQKELADAIGIDPRVLSRKLHGAKKSMLTQTEVKHIIQLLAEWGAITTQDEACTLLTTMGLKKESFSTQEWQSVPLNHLEAACPALHTLPTHPVPQILPHQSLTPPSFPIPATSLIGREEQIQIVHDLLRQDSVRLLTLFGTGGVGKTRLAFAVAQAARHDFADGIFFLPLASLQDVLLVPAMLVQLLRLRAPRQPQTVDQLTDCDSSISHEALLTQFLQHKRLLLIFDNVEHLPAIDAFINALLQQAPALKIMVTSRVLIHLYGEYAFDVPPLDTWPDDHLPTQGLLPHLPKLPPSPAMRLFIARAQTVSSTFALTSQNAVTISRICTRLDGLPLAIELAAARSKVVQLPTILQWLTNGTAHTFLRTTAHNIFHRHQTLQATLNWSYSLLPPSYQQLLRSYSIFVGGWTIEAAQAIVTTDHQQNASDDILTQMEFLIDQSLVKRMPFDGLVAEAVTTDEQIEPRFYLLETIRDYALHLLESADEHAAIQQRHATYYHALVVRTEPLLAGDTYAEALSLLLREHDNFRAALSWANAHNHTDIALRMSSALGRFWEIRMQFREAQRWIDAVFTRTTDSPLSALRSGLLLAHHTGNTYMFATALLACGCVMGTLTADPSYPARLYSAAETLYSHLQTAVPTAYRPTYRATLSAMQTRVSSATWLAWWAEGHTLSREDCCTLVLSVNPKDQATQ